MLKLLSEHPLIQKKKMIQFRIDESVAYSQIPICDNHSALFQIKGQGQFWDLENCGVQEEKRRSAGRRSRTLILSLIS